MIKRSSLVLLFGLVLFSGCTVSQTPIKGSRIMQEQSYNVIKTSQYPQDTTGKKEFKSYHSDDQSDIEAFKAEYSRLTGEDAPEFDGNMIIAKSGEMPNGGYDISILEVQSFGRYTEVTILLESPASGCIVTEALTNPYIIAEIPNDHRDIKFIEKKIIKTCD
jgi:hypothetical protein